MNWILIGTIFITIMIAEIVLGIKTRSLPRGKLLLGIALTQLILPIITMGVCHLFCPSEPVEAPLAYFSFAIGAEALLAFLALLVIAVIVTGLLTKQTRETASKQGVQRAADI